MRYRTFNKEPNFFNTLKCLNMISKMDSTKYRKEVKLAKKLYELLGYLMYNIQFEKTLSYIQARNLIDRVAMSESKKRLK